jgi:ADP-heptose:LPS heptosyltransferase
LNHIKILKHLDSIAGLFLCRLLSLPKRTTTIVATNKILIVRPGGIGDAVLLAPTIQFLREKFPESSVTVFAEKRNAEIFDLIPGLTQVLRYDVPAEFLTAFRLKPDIVIDTEQYHRLSAVVARLAGAGILIGFGTNERGRLFHHALPYSHDDYEANSFFQLLAPLGITPPEALNAPFLSVPPLSQTRASQLLAPLAGKPVVILFPGASIPERRWGGECFRQVAARLAEQGYGIVVIGGKDDLAAGDAIIPANSLNLAGKTSLVESAAIIERAVLLISGDSGVLHLGVGLGISTVSLFGSGIAQKWAPRGANHIVLNKNLPCSPCTRFGYTPKCPRQAECLQHINPQEVIDAAMTLLAGAKKSPGCPATYRSNSRRQVV